MKRGPNDINDTLPVKKMRIITQSLQELLQEVSKGQYEDFRDYLIQNAISDLYLESDVQGVDLFHLGCALQGTAVTTLGLLFNNIVANDAEKLGKALKGTAVTHLNLSYSNIGDEVAEKLGKALQGTAVNTLSVGNNNIGDEGAENLGNALKGSAITILNLWWNNISSDGAEKLGLALKGTKVTALDLSCNLIDADGAEKLGKALQGTAVTTLNVGFNKIGAVGAKKLGITLKDTAITTVNLSGNNIGKDGTVAFAACIPDTLLMNVKLGFKDEALEQALALNERKLIQTPYSAICLTHLPANEKKKYYNLPALGDTPSNEEQITFAGGILAALGTYKPDLQAQIISFLPLMNYQGAEKLQALAQTHHGKGLQIEGEPKINSKPKC